MFLKDNKHLIKNSLLINIHSNVKITPCIVTITIRWRLLKLQFVSIVGHKIFDTLEYIFTNGVFFIA